jgi:sugar transport system substrate-binding protein
MDSGTEGPAPTTGGTGNVAAEPQSAALASGTQLEARLESLKASFANVERISDPLARKMAQRLEAERLQIRENRYTALFAVYKQQRLPRWLFEPQLGRLVDRFAHLSIFKFFGYIGRFAILIAIVSFFSQCADHRRQARIANLGILESTQGVVVSRARIQALEKLNEDCYDLGGIRADYAQLSGLRLDRCYSFPGGRLIGAWLPVAPQGATLYRAHLDNADLRSAHLSRANLNFASLARASLNEADLHLARLRGADLQRAHLPRANLQRADLRDANLDDADLSGADLSGANLTGAHLQNALLIGAQLVGATLQHADLQGVRAARALLSGADLFKAKLRGGLFCRARFSGRTSLDSADLTAADLRGVVGLPAHAILAANNWHLAELDPGWFAPTEQPPRVGLLVLDSQYFFQEVKEGAAQAARDRQVPPPVVRLVAAEPGREAVTERRLVDGLIAAGVDGILIDPEDRYVSALGVRDAFMAGLVVVCYDHCIDDEAARAYVTADFESDQFELGRETGKAVARWIGPPHQGAKPPAVGISRYCETDGCNDRLMGFRTALDAAQAHWTMATSYSRQGHETSLELATAMLRDHPEISVAWSANESGTEGLVNAVRALGRQGKVKVWGTDISPNIAKVLLAPDSTLQAVTGEQPKQMGYLAMSALIAALRRETPDTGPHHTDLELFERSDHGPIERYRATHPMPSALRLNR